MLYASCLGTPHVTPCKVGERAKKACLTALTCWRDLRYGRESAGSELRQRGAEQAAHAGVTLQRDLHGSCKCAGGSHGIRNAKWPPSHQGPGEGRGRLGVCFTLVNVPPFGSEASSSPGSTGALCVPSVGTRFPGSAHCILQNCPGSGAEAALGTAFLRSRGLPGR